MTNSAPDNFFQLNPQLNAIGRHGCWQTNIHRANKNGAADHLQQLPVETTPLLMAQRLSMESHPVLCICENYQAAQRHYVEATAAADTHHQQIMLLHEMMPLYQQEYVLECLRVFRDFALDCRPVIFTSAVFYREIKLRAPEVLIDLKTIEIGNITSAGITDEQDAAPTITCICLRVGAGDRWVLMDHENAAVITPTELPSPDITRRLLNHTVQISGNRIAPYLAMMFDVPNVWKSNLELAQCALLIFRDDECPTGCFQPGIPRRIIWNDLLGIVFQD